MLSFLLLGKDSTLAGYFLQKYGAESIALNKKECDITDANTLEKTLRNSKAKYIINCAALTDVRHCESNPVECYEVNTMPVLVLSKLCRKYNKKLIHFSSDYAVNPTNIYGYSKFLSEQLADPNRDLVIRTSFYSPKYYIIKSLRSGETTNAYKNMFFNPVSVTRLVEEIFKNKDKVESLNIFTDKKISKYEFAKKVARSLGISEKLIHPVNYVNKKGELKLPLNSYVKSDIEISLNEDLKKFFLKSID
jgi:dTDP-4-dehydrorhamnose reductase